MSEPISHLTAETLDTFFHSGNVVTVRLASEPDCRLRIDPPGETLELWTPAVGPEPDVTTLSRLSVSTEEMGNGAWMVLSVDARDAHLEAYSLLASVVDDLRAGRSFNVATARSLKAFREVLEHRGRLREEKAIGLLGELLILLHLIDALSEEEAVEAWLGPRSEEHDFVLEEIDAEVKTTLSERRSHVIGTETQLQPSPGRPLWLLSIQLTRAGTAVGGFGLPDIISRLRDGLASTGDRVNAYFATQGWHDGDSDLYGETYMPRSAPAAYLVDERFPAITRARLDSVVPQPEYVGQVSYRVDVTSLVSASPPGALAGFVQEAL